MTSFDKLREYLKPFNTGLMLTIYPVTNRTLVSSVEIPTGVDTLKQEEAERMSDLQIFSRLVEMPGKLDQTDIYFLINGEDRPFSLVQIAKVSKGRREKNNFQSRLLGAMVYHSICSVFGGPSQNFL